MPLEATMARRLRRLEAVTDDCGTGHVTRPARAWYSAAMPRRGLYAEIERLPQTMVGEIVDGEVFASPRPATPHALAATRIASDLTRRFDGPADGPDAPGGWWILFEPELHLGDDVLVPDVAGWRRSRLPALPSVAAVTMAPDWVCEVVSPSTALLDRGHKMRAYVRAGVDFLWLVDPALRTLETYRRDEDRWIVRGAFGGGATARAEPFDATELAPARWWID